MRAAVIAFTRRGARLAGDVAQKLGASVCVPARLSGELGLPAFDSLEGWTANAWGSCDELIFVGACGIAVRAIAPHVKDKFKDPAVICIDEAGHFVIPVLSGHVGGANVTAKAIADFLGAQPVISTATDVNGVFAVDVWASERGLVISDRTLAKRVSAALLEGESFSIISDFPISGAPEQGGKIEIYLTCKTKPDTALRLIPRVVTLGIGCRRGTKCDDIDAAVLSALNDSGIDMRAVGQVCSIDLKKDEAGLIEFCEKYALEFTTFTAQQLKQAQGSFTPSDFVLSVTGVDNVCERSAMLGGGRMVIGKTALNGVTVAGSIREPCFEF